MQEVMVDLPPGERQGYKIRVGIGLLSKVGSLYDVGRYSKVFVVTDETVEPLLLKELLVSLPDTTASLKLPAGEKHKGIESVKKIWQALHAAGCDRQSLVINLGGGVIGDVGGFAAATYMRGLDFINVPTTLLAQVDAGAGGKTGFNFDGIKNLVGTFDQPVGIVIDTRTLKTLPEREFVSGFSEIIKHGAIRDRAYFDQVTAKRPREFSEAELVDVITGSCRIKAEVVGTDETEGDQRKLLNFGHSVGHAMEALSHDTDAPLLHGEAVSIGMVAEAVVSHAQNRLPAASLERLRQALTAAGLPVSTPGLAIDKLFDKMRSDKKNDRGRLKFTLLDDIGRAVYDQEVPEEVISEALQTVLD